MNYSGLHRVVGANALQSPAAPTPGTVFPEHFQGVFARVRERHGALFVEARESLRAVPMVEEFRPYFLHGVLGHAQPGFMLVPMMYLAFADAVDGVNEDDRAYLPWSILSMELSAILDDTIDRTPYRSGRKTYVHEFGEASSTAMANYLFSLVVARSAEVSPALVPVVTGFFTTFSSLLVWEFHSRYPQASVQACERWMQVRYEAGAAVYDIVFNSALALRGMAFMPPRVCALAGEVAQDVDDLVNFLDRRERVGENDDIKMGIMSYALFHALRASDDVAPALEALWRHYRRLPATSLEGFWSDHAQCGAETVPEYEALSELVARHGVPATAQKLVADARACVAAAPEPFRPCVRDIMDALIARVRRLNALPAPSREALARPL